MSEDEARVERVADALIENFKTVVSEHAGEPFEATKVSVPPRDIWLRMARCAIAATTAWQPIETAPRDGTKIDLLFPYPRGRQKDCQWRQDGVYGDGNWFWSIPKWGSQPGREWHLLPEDEWDVGGYPNMQPTHWMPIPEPPK